MENETLVFATSNVGKLKEIREMLEPLGYHILSLDDVHLKVEHPENSETYEGNSRIKAEDIAARCDYPVIADDSGLSIEALNGFPGLHSARFLEGHPYSEKNRAILEMMKNIKDRRASYFTVVTYIDKKKGVEVSFPGENKGEIVASVDEHPINGFGYDPIFYSYDVKKTFSQTKPEEKDAISHRGRAIRQLVEYLKQHEGE